VGAQTEVDAVSECQVLARGPGDHETVGVIEATRISVGRGHVRMLGHAKASMTLDVYADLFDDDLDDVAANLDAAMRAAKDPLGTDQNLGPTGDARNRADQRQTVWS
jgi:hypothetical protein